MSFLSSWIILIINCRTEPGNFYYRAKWPKFETKNNNNYIYEHPIFGMLWIIGNHKQKTNIVFGELQMVWIIQLTRKPWTAVFTILDNTTMGFNCGNNVNHCSPETSSASVFVVATMRYMIYLAPGTCSFPPKICQYTTAQGSFWILQHN